MPQTVFITRNNDFVEFWAILVDSEPNFSPFQPAHFEKFDTQLDLAVGAPADGARSKKNLRFLAGKGRGCVKTH
jgi:hypothetical protein